MTRLKLSLEMEIKESLMDCSYAKLNNFSMLNDPREAWIKCWYQTNGLQGKYKIQLKLDLSIALA